MAAPTIVITLDNRCEFVIDKNNRLLMNQRHKDGFIMATIDLGLATEQLIENTQDYLGKLYIHAVKEKAVA